MSIQSELEAITNEAERHRRALELIVRPSDSIMADLNSYALYANLVANLALRGPSDG